jgi:hypothetical protein
MEKDALEDKNREVSTICKYLKTSIISLISNKLSSFNVELNYSNFWILETTADFVESIA